MFRRVDETSNLVITGSGYLSGSKCDPNGFRSSTVGYVHVRRGTSANLTFSLVDGNSGLPISVPALHFTLFDIDQESPALS